mmetsp:Transcript_33449/g.56175  ORF Transcript_33449/g.56175 Transcript_33449/m.56175 type:complete len:232 (-) Transcript_33449:834-1529(-)
MSEIHEFKRSSDNEVVSIERRFEYSVLERTPCRSRLQLRVERSGDRSPPELHDSSHTFRFSSRRGSISVCTSGKIAAIILKKGCATYIMKLDKLRGKLLSAAIRGHTGMDKRFSFKPWALNSSLIAPDHFLHSPHLLPTKEISAAFRMTFISNSRSLALLFENSSSVSQSRSSNRLTSLTCFDMSVARMHPMTRRCSSSCVSVSKSLKMSASSSTCQHIAAWWFSATDFRL